MKKNWKILVAVLAIAVLAFGMLGTGAWFTDTTSINNNVITTGDLTLTAWGGPLSISNLEPGAGYKAAGVFCARNDGDYNLKFRGFLTAVSDPKGLQDYVLVRAVINPAGNQGNYGPKITEIFNDVPYTQLMNPNNGHLTLDADLSNPNDLAFGPGYWACWLVEAKLIDSAPNTVQNATLTAKFQIDATQRINPGW